MLRWFVATLLKPEAARTTLLHMVNETVTRKDTADRMQRSQKQAAERGLSLYLANTSN